MPCTVDGLMAWLRGWRRGTAMAMSRPVTIAPAGLRITRLYQLGLFWLRLRLYCAADCAASARHGSRCALPDGVTRPAAGGGSAHGTRRIGARLKKGTITVHRGVADDLYRPARGDPGDSRSGPAHGVALPWRWAAARHSSAGSSCAAARSTSRGPALLDLAQQDRG